MKLSSSSTSSSEPAGARRAVLPVAAYTVLWLVVLDVAIDLATRMPDDPRVQPSKMQGYFDYGRSVESKLRRMVGATREQSTPVAVAGWLDPAEPVTMPARASRPGRVLIAAYGQSFTGNLFNALHEQDPRFEIRVRGGPGSPLSHSFEMYRMDRGQHEAQVVVIGVLASAIPGLASLTNMTVQFESPAPCTYPRFVLQDGRLRAIQPSVRSFEQLQAALREPQRWRDFVDELADNDAGFNRFVFERDPLDFSSLGRTIRRGLGQKHAREFNALFLDQNGFVNHLGVLDVADALLAEFAETARGDGKLAYVVLFNDRGYDDHLFRALGPRLSRRGIDHFSTHEVAPPSQVQVFLGDGHYLPHIDRALAAAFREQLLADLAARGIRLSAAARPAQATPAAP
jgi:hypothetical protein